MNYLKYIAKTGRINQHPYGQLGTHILLNKFILNANKKTILEIGCGTGHTAATIANDDNIVYNGVDTMPEMINFCNKRKKELKLKKCNFTLISNNIYPFPDKHFDIVFCESVLAIQSLESFSNIINESYRVLKNNGMLLFNETIWNETTPTSIREKTNKMTIKYYNLIQAEKNATLKNWEEKISICQFKIIEIKEITSRTVKKNKKPINYLESNSTKYSRRTKYLSFLNPKNIFLFLFFKISNKIFKTDIEQLKTYLFICKKSV